jgi:type IV pilus modification protein PilV
MQLPGESEFNRHSVAHPQKGFSLIEVLIGLVFLAIGILAFASLQITSIRGNSFSHNLMQATYVAQDRIEFLKNLSFDSPQLQSGKYHPEPVTISGVVFNHSYTVAANGRLKKIDYTVAWNDGVNHRVVYSTIRSQ